MAAILTYDDFSPEIRATLDDAYRELERRRWLEGIAALAAIVDAHPAYIHGVFHLGRALRKVERRDEARARFAAAAAIAPDDPRICLGLAWAHLDAKNDGTAEELANRGLLAAKPEIRSELLAVVAQVADAQGRTADAARLYLQAYEEGTMLGWLERHCALVGIPYSIDTKASAPWPLTCAARRWMYAAIDAALSEAAEAKVANPPPGKRRIIGCDGSARLTARWAAKAGVDRARLYQALAARGGYCDCEVLMNATSDDDELRGFALVQGDLDGDPADAVRGFRDLVHEGAPTAPATLERDAEVPEEFLGVCVDGARIPLQVTDSMTLGEVLRSIGDQPRDRAAVRLLVGFIDEDLELVIAGPDGAPLRFHTLAPPTADLEAVWPGIGAAIAQLRAGLPSPP